MQVHAEFSRFAPAAGVRVGLAVGATRSPSAARARRRAPRRGDGGAGDGGYRVRSRRSARARAPRRVVATADTALERDSDAEDPDGRRPTGRRGRRSRGRAQSRRRARLHARTPGEHLEGTPGFTLQHVRFLVVDEADRPLGRRTKTGPTRRGAAGARAHAAAAATRERLSAPRKSPLPSPPRIGCDVDAGVRGASIAALPARGAAAADTAEHDTRRSDPTRAQAPRRRRIRCRGRARGRRARPEDAAHPAHGAATAPSIAPSAAPSAAPPALRRLLFSATLSSRSSPPRFGSPTPSSSRCDRRPRGGAADAAAAATAREGGFALPATLREGYVCCETNRSRPRCSRVRRAMPGAAGRGGRGRARARPPGPHLVFTSSVDSARRVARLIESLSRCADAAARLRRVVAGSRRSAAAVARPVPRGHRVPLEADRGRPAPPRVPRRAPRAASSFPTSPSPPRAQVLVCSDGAARGSISRTFRSS